MKTLLMLSCACMALSSCATLTNTLGTKEAVALCSTADVVSTGVALHHGAIETNPITKLILKPFGIFGYVGLSAWIVWYIYQHEQEMSKTELTVISTVRCGAAINNGTL